MMSVITFVSIMLYIYNIGYMHEDLEDQRFFSYISLFTFAMLMLVMANNFLQLFFGWEAVGLVSYLLIGFWYKKPTAIHANLKAFIVNRVGDFGFLLGIAAVWYLTDSLNYAEVFAAAPSVSGTVLEVLPGRAWDAVTVACLLLFIGARVGWAGANLFYDAFLVDVATPDRMDSVSAKGFGFGYIGSVIPFVAVIGLILSGGLADGLPVAQTRMGFIVVALWWFFLSLPAIRNLQQHYYVPPSPNPFRGESRMSFSTGYSFM